MKYRLNKEHIEGMLRHLGLAITIGGLFYAVLEEGSLHIAIPFTIIGVLFAIIGSLERKHD